MVQEWNWKIRFKRSSSQMLGFSLVAASLQKNLAFRPVYKEAFDTAIISVLSIFILKVVFSIFKEF